MQHPETITITLRVPVELDGKTYKDIDLCEPTVGQLEKSSAAGDGIAANIVLVSEVAKLPLAVVRLMRKRDFEQACDYLAGFTLPQAGSGS